jgi:GH24 family phage-related lysozyme (muramidase)
MQASVRAAWCDFNRSLEGWISWMYLDVKGLVTSGMGNLIDPAGAALTLPWVDGTGAAASQADIQAEWQQVKGNLALAHQGANAAKQVTTLRLGDSDIGALVLAKLDHNENILKSYAAFSRFDAWPADAQLGLLSMAWAMGPGFGPNFPHFAQAVDAGDFATAAGDCEMNASANPGLVRRNAANRQAFLYAAGATDPTALRSAVPPH